MDSVKSGGIDLSLMLSEHYGKNIRQGHSFQIAGVQAYLKPHDDSVNDDYDVGGSVLLQMQYIPTTGHSKRAWNQAFSIWSKQRKLDATLGQFPVRNEDFEFAFNTALKDTNRTSKMNRNMESSQIEYACLTGDSTGGDDWCLSDYYNTTNQAPERTANHFSGALYKDDKYGGTKFPEVQFLSTHAKSSSIVTKFDSIGTNTYFSGGDIEAEWQMLPSPANVLCGLLRYDTMLIPGDTAAQMEDNMELIVCFAIRKWKPLIVRPRPKRAKKSTRRKSSGRRFSRKRGRR